MIYLRFLEQYEQKQYNHNKNATYKIIILSYVCTVSQ